MTVSHCFVTLGGMDLPVEHLKSGTFLDLVIDIVLGRAEVVGRIVVKRWVVSGRRDLLSCLLTLSHERAGRGEQIDPLGELIKPNQGTNHLMPNSRYSG